MLKNYLDLPKPIYLLCIGIFVNRAGTLVIVFLSRYLNEELGFSTAQSTSTLGYFGAGSLLAALVGGYLADTLGRKPVMLIALFGGAGVLTLFAELRTPVEVYAAAFTFAFFGEMYRPAASAMIADLVEPSRRAHAFGLMYFAINLGFSAAPLIGGILADYSYRYLFWIDAITAGAYAMLIVFKIKETLTTSSGKESQESVSFVQAAAHIARDRVFLIYFVAIFFSSVVYLQHISTFPIFADQNGVGATVFGRLIAINGIMIVCLQLPVTSWVNRHSRGSMMMLGSLLIGVGYWLNAFGGTSWYFAMTVAIWTLGELVQAPLLMAIVGDLSPKNMRGRYMGMIGVSFATAMMIGAPIGGWVMQVFSGQTLWWWCLILGSISAALFLLIYRQIEMPHADVSADSMTIES
ncbi:MAG: MDR family MFS transporter [Planctomycetota bacterium]|jgi:MFS family permease